MSRSMLELALKKQRLQIRSSALRSQWAGHVAGLEPALAAGDRVGAGLVWLRRHPQLPVAVAVALLVARPRAAFRWARRSFVLWQAWRRARRWFAGRLTTPQ